MLRVVIFTYVLPLAEAEPIDPADQHGSVVNVAAFGVKPETGEERCSLHGAGGGNLLRASVPDKRNLAVFAMAIRTMLEASS